MSSESVILNKTLIKDTFLENGCCTYTLYVHLSKNHWHRCFFYGINDHDYYEKHHEIIAIEISSFLSVAL